jgi:response regulator RpfG family c-di-GMP phosphodiesterase
MMRTESGRHFDPLVLGHFFDSLPQIQTIRAGYLDGMSSSMSAIDAATH